MHALTGFIFRVLTNHQDLLAWRWRSGKILVHFPVRLIPGKMNNSPNHSSRTPNLLIHESSTYLLQHAYNPVAWHPWNARTLARAQSEDKPILLSIGYSACHWCHVMERECFENEAVAEFMNRHFINIKVDREERPDLDSIYMNYVQALTGSGGWPLNVFLTPTLLPIFGGTYFPPDDRWGRPGFPRILEAVTQAYQTKKEEILEQGQVLVQNLGETQMSYFSGSDLKESTLSQAYRNISQQFDWEEGGWRGAPKFPTPSSLDFCLHYYARTGQEDALRFVDFTLQKMAEGGIYDQLGGGFHRYSVDDHWLVPHFEKMLYDNALLSRLYLHGYQATGKLLYERVARETLDYLIREMTSPEGGFYSSQDADSDGEEGKFFLWSHQEISQLLDPAAATAFCRAFGVTETGNFEGANILHIPAGNQLDSSHASPFQSDPLLAASRKQLFTAREKRNKPGRDEKILTGWNGLVISALAEASQILDCPKYLEAARQNAQLLLANALPDGHLARTITPGKPAAIPGFLEDYANLAEGLVMLFEVSGQTQWLTAALRLAGIILEEFWDAEASCFFLNSRSAERLIVRPTDLYDHATPSGGSTAALLLLQLFQITGETRFFQTASIYLKKMSAAMERAPMGFGRLLCAASWHLDPGCQIVISGTPAHPLAQEMIKALFASYLPMKILGVLPPGQSNEQYNSLPIFKGKENDGDVPMAYVCKGSVCYPPAPNPEELKRLLLRKSP